MSKYIVAVTETIHALRIVAAAGTKHLVEKATPNAL